MLPSRSLSIIQNHQHPSYAFEGACIQFPSSPSVLAGYSDLPRRRQHQPTSFPVYFACLQVKWPILSL